MVSKVLDKKLSLLADINQRCRDFYIDSNINGRVNGVITSQGKYSPIALDDLISDLETKNQNAQVNSCSPLY